SHRRHACPAPRRYPAAGPSRSVPACAGGATRLRECPVRAPRRRGGSRHARCHHDLAPPGRRGLFPHGPGRNPSSPVFRRPTPPLLLVLDTESGKEIARVPSVGDADDLFYDAPHRRLYIAGGTGSLSIVAQEDADHYTPVATIPTAAGARTALWVPALGRLYLAVPHRDTQGAEIRGYAVPYHQPAPHPWRGAC